ncbi:MAG TPA: HAMP domain-containing sensor histidine kinase [Bryobacteraceae bacterium]|nr:HAMP domain-containing sensor histidine kinase [Bryobacteraceae bacterium]
MKNASISLRLTAWFSAIFLGGFVLFGLIMWADLALSLSQGRDRTLTRRAARIAGVLDATRHDPPSVREARYQELADNIPEGNLIQVYTATGQRIFPRTPSPADFPWPTVTAISRPKFSNLKVQGRPFRLLKTPLETEPMIILVAGQLEDNRNMLARFTTGLAGAIPVMLLLSALGGYLLVRRALRPVEQITDTLRLINIGNLSHRLPISPARDELQRLAETCNQMLARLQDAVDRINRFTADASHELRSPVALIRAVAEYGLRNPNLDAENKEALGEILAEAVEAGRLIEDMLTLARADAGHGLPAFEPLELADLVREVCDRMRPLAEAKGQLVTIRAEPSTWTTGDRQSIRRLLSILLDNAIKYTPAGGHIETEVASNGSRPAVSVRDSGIGIPAEALPKIFDRFARADPSRGEVSGTGLGLAVAKWIANVHHAILTVRSREHEGSVFTVEFPSAEPIVLEGTPLVGPAVLPVEPPRATG